MPRMPLSGVRISWLMLARNSLLARLADPRAGGANCVPPGEVGDESTRPLECRLELPQLRVRLAEVAHVAGRDHPQGARLQVQAGDGHVDGNPTVFLVGAEQEPVAGVKESGMLLGGAHRALRLHPFGLEQ